MSNVTKLKSADDELESWIDNFWQWSCHIYQNQEVAKLCIAVQDTLGLNVNYMLLALWTQYQHIPISQDNWQLIEDDSASAVDAINYIREKRVALKGKSEDAYKQALLIELKAEQQHQRQAVQSLHKQYQGVKQQQLAQNNLKNYLDSHQISTENQDTVQQLGHLVQNISL
ncbi:MAG: TIGR02444 family protein [Gammaproteobacteria bacterium]|nr:TIGR02444 family protein [Gammaproteobacteria bacterium]